VGNAVIKTLDQARDEAREVLNRVFQGESPVEERKKHREIPTLKEFWENEYDEYQKENGKLSTINTNKSRWKHLERELGDRKVSSITDDDAKMLHAKITKRSPISKKPCPTQADRVIALLSSMMSLCEERPYCYRAKNTNPCADVALNGTEERDRHLDPEKEHDPVTGEEVGPGELERFLKAISDSLKDGSEHPRVIICFC
jgi:hypothetical protein